ncbi:Ankyrin 2 [Carabus blaptoides fortunei]
MQRRNWWEVNGDSDGDTPLHFAAASGRCNLLFNYLSLGDNINAANRMGWTPLMQAARNGHCACVKLLLDFKADVSCRNIFGVCSLSHAAASGNIEIVRAILQAIVKRGLPLRDCEQPISPLIFAILFNHVDIIRYLNNKSFDLRKICDMGDLCPVMCASILKNKETMELLKRRGISPMKMMIKFSPISRSPPNTSNSLQVPSLYVTNDSIAPETPIFLPNIPSSFVTPLLGNSVEAIEKKLRKFSSLSIASTPKSPDLSPIMFPDTPRPSFSSYSTSNMFDSPANDYLNTRFSVTPTPLILTDSNNSSSLYSRANDNIFQWLAPTYQRETKARSASHCAPIERIETTENGDDVFDSSVINTCAAPKSNEREFVELLRRNSLDSCVSLFQKHEIDMDMFLTLSKSDLNEIGVDWEKRDDVLELIYLLNKRM